MDYEQTRNEPFTLPRLLLCEGPDDCAFFDRLIEIRNLPKFHIQSSSLNRYAPAGNAQFTTALDAIQGNRNYDALRHILIVSDNDSDHTTKFTKVCEQIEAAGLPRPIDPLKPVGTFPSITVMMIPLDGSEGNLESLLLDAAAHACKIVAARIETCMAVLEAEKWPIPRKGKLWLRINLAARAPDPFASLLTILLEKRKKRRLIPLDHSSFLAVEKVLRSCGDPPAPARTSVRADADEQPAKKRVRNQRRSPMRQFRGRLR